MQEDFVLETSALNERIAQLEEKTQILHAEAARAKESHAATIDSMRAELHVTQHDKTTVRLV